MTGLIDDYINSYDIDGLIYVNETQGAFTDMIGARFRGRRRGLPDRVPVSASIAKARQKSRGYALKICRLLSRKRKNLSAPDARTGVPWTAFTSLSGVCCSDIRNCFNGAFFP